MTCSGLCRFRFIAVSSSLPILGHRTRTTGGSAQGAPVSIAERKGATPGQLALAWLLAKAPWVVPIPGTRRLDRLEENVGASELDLNTEDLAEINAAAEDIKIEGARYPEHLERMTNL